MSKVKGKNIDGISVLIADDHAVVLKGLTAFFETAADLHVAATASTAAEAVSAAGSVRPDVVLLDLLLPDQDAVTTVNQIRKASPKSRIIILTSHEGNEYISDVLEAGALSYILKDINPDDLIDAIRKTAQNQKVLNERLAQFLVDDFKGESRELHDRLTDREREVLLQIAKGMTNGEIAAKLFISETTVKSHVSSILSKLYLTDRTKLAVYAWEKGLVKA